MTFPDWTHIIVHHSAGKDREALDYAGILRWHTTPPPNGNGWSDIGYQAVAEFVGSAPVCIYGRGTHRRGSHAGPKWNGRALGICFVGDYREHPPPMEMLEVAATRVLRPWVREWNIPLRNIIGHGTALPGHTECPGRAFPLQALKRLI